MSRRKKPPHRQPRGPRATVPAPEPRPERPSAHDYMSGAACDGCCNWADECECHLWHAYKECPCALVAHRDPHPAADCPCQEDK